LFRRKTFVRYAVNMRSSVPPGDRQLVQIVDAALAEAARKSGTWLACHKGCTQCCFGPFPINQLDAARLRQGMIDLEQSDPQRASRVRSRARATVARLDPVFPGDPITGILGSDKAAEERFVDFANDEACPALDPGSGSCDLYAARPMTCRIFGPPVRSGPEGGLGICELCYHGATDQQIAACEMSPDPSNVEDKLLKQLERKTHAHGQTIVAYCLLPENQNPG